jgi:hypothetical protein
VSRLDGEDLLETLYNRTQDEENRPSWQKHWNRSCEHQDIAFMTPPLSYKSDTHRTHNTTPSDRQDNIFDRNVTSVIQQRDNHFRKFTVTNRDK